MNLQPPDSESDALPIEPHPIIETGGGDRNRTDITAVQAQSFPIKPHPQLVISNTLVLKLLVIPTKMVEVAGIEPASENPPQKDLRSYPLYSFNTFSKEGMKTHQVPLKDRYQ